MGERATFLCFYNASHLNISLLLFPARELSKTLLFVLYRRETNSDVEVLDDSATFSRVMTSV